MWSDAERNPRLSDGSGHTINRLWRLWHVEPGRTHVLPNSRSNCPELMWIIVGRPCGHVCGWAHASS